MWNCYVMNMLSIKKDLCKMKLFYTIYAKWCLLYDQAFRPSKEENWRTCSEITPDVL